MQALVQRRSQAAEILHQHRGAYHVLIAEGSGAWRYHMLTRKLYGFWRWLSGAERNYIVRLGLRHCFVCALRVAMERQESAEAALHAAMMSFLLLPVKDSQSD